VTTENINVASALKEVEKLLDEEKQLSTALRSSIDGLIDIVKLLANRIGLNSHNSSKPPSTDWNENENQNAQDGSSMPEGDEKDNEKEEASGRKPGGQPGHVGKTLRQFEEPDEVEPIYVDHTILPEGDYEEADVEKRQVVDIQISRWVTEYHAQVLINKETGERHVAPFPTGVTKAVQYGNKIKEHACYTSVHQLIPYKRVLETFNDQLDVPVSEGSLYNFNLTAFNKLELFENITKQKLIDAPLIHADETGININGDSRHWLHCATNASWTFYYPHKKRGQEAIDEMDIIPHFRGVLCHDHWKTYYCYMLCLHALCNAHHLRELIRAWEQDKQQWAEELRIFLEAVNVEVHEAGGVLDDKASAQRWRQYREILERAKIECPGPNEEDRPPGKRGRLKRSKARNLLERFINFEDDVMRFMDNVIVPFTNNQGERDIRMTKVHQKISGCFRSMQGALMFCRIRGYLSTCKKHGLTSSYALELLFNDELPEFAK
jgi:transposase